MEDLTISASNSTGRQEALLSGTHQAREAARKGVRAQHRVEPAIRSEGRSVQRDSVTRENLAEIAESLNRYFSGGRGIRFEVSPDSNDFVVQVVDRASDEVIRSIPPEQILALREHFEEVRGLLLDDHA